MEGARVWGKGHCKKKKKSQKRAGEVPPSIDPKFKSQYCKTKQNKKITKIKNPSFQGYQSLWSSSRMGDRHPD
jgi:hypothetical protein